MACERPPRPLRFLDGCALSGLHSQPLMQRRLREIFLMSRPPLLWEEGNGPPENSFGRRVAALSLLCSSFVLFVFLPLPAQRTTRLTAATRLNNLGVAYMNQARIAEALQTFRRAEAQDASLFAARLNEGIALLHSQQLAEARDVLLDATRRLPQSARAWYNLGIVYRTLAQTDAAI